MQTLLHGYYVDYANFMCISFGYIVCNVSCVCVCIIVWLLSVSCHEFILVYTKLSTTALNNNPLH